MHEMPDHVFTTPGGARVEIRSRGPEASASDWEVLQTLAPSHQRIYVTVNGIECDTGIVVELGPDEASSPNWSAREPSLIDALVAKGFISG